MMGLVASTSPVVEPALDECASELEASAPAIRSPRFCSSIEVFGFDID